MRLLIKDSIKIALIFIVWILALYYFKDNNKAIAALINFPVFFLISLVYFAGCMVCYNIIMVQEGDNEYNNLLKDVAEAKKFYIEHKIKYN